MGPHDEYRGKMILEMVILKFKEDVAMTAHICYRAALNQIADHGMSVGRLWYHMHSKVHLHHVPFLAKTFEVFAQSGTIGTSLACIPTTGSMCAKQSFFLDRFCF